MLLSISILLIGSLSGTCVVPEGDKLTQRSLTYQAFDSSADEFSWRSLSATGCTDAAVDMLQAYLKHNATQLTAEDRMTIEFHIGQVLAFAGRDGESIAFFREADGAGATPEWRVYVRATLAFLQHDAQALRAMRDAYAGVSSDAMRLLAIDGFIACPDEKYAKAIHCKI